MKLTFKGGVTELGRRYIICKERDVVATLENRVSSVAMQLEDSINKQGITIVGAVDRDNNIVIGIKDSKSLATPLSWSYCNKIDPLNGEVSLEIDGLPESFNSLIVKEI